MSSHKRSGFFCRKLTPQSILFYILLIVLLSHCSADDTNTGNKGDFTGLTQLFDEASEKTESGNIKGGLEFIDSSLSDKKLNVLERFKVLDYKNGICFQGKDTANAMVFADSMLSLIEKNDKEKYNEEYALANYSKGDVLFLEKKYNEAYNYYSVARHIGKVSLDLCTLSEYNYRIGMVLYQQSRFTEAAENFEEAFMQSQSCATDFSRYFRRQEILSNTALSFQKAGNYDSAIHFYNTALQYLTENDGKYKDKEYLNDVARGVIYGNEGDIYKGQGNFEKAKNLYRKSIDINTKKGYDNKDAQFTQLKLAEVYYVTNNADSMRILLQQIRQSLDLKENNKAEIDWNRLMWKYNESNHDVAKAYQYLKKYITLGDSAQTVKNKLNLDDVTKHIKVLEDQYNISSLQKENKLKGLYLIIFITLSAFGMVVLLFSLALLRNSKKNYSTLKNLNQQIEDQKVTLKNTLSQLEDRSREKDRILRVVAHDLRSPAASISMMTDLLLDEKDDSTRTEMLKLVKSSCDKSLALIAEILEATEMENKSQLLKEKTGVNELLKEAIAPLRYKAAEKQQTILVKALQENENLLVNKEKIVRVIINLVTNAIKFSPDNTEILVKAEKKAGAIQIMVKDNGIGIPGELKNKVFDMFTEAKRTGTAGEKPFGLGLSICRQIVEAHGGKIWFESEPGKGTTFFVELQENLQNAKL